ITKSQTLSRPAWHYLSFPLHIGVWEKNKFPISKKVWARQDSNLGPRDYESPALPLSYRPVGARAFNHSIPSPTNSERRSTCVTPELQPPGDHVALKPLPLRFPTSFPKFADVSDCGLLLQDLG